MIQTKTLVLMAALWVQTNPFASAGPPLSQRSLTVSVVWDTSCSNGPYWPSYHSIIRQVCSSLRPLDRIEIITAQAGAPKLRVSQCIRTGDSQELANIYLLLENITCPFLSDARADRAVEMAAKRIIDASAAGKDGPALLIVLTNGSLSQQEVRAIRNAAEQFAVPWRKLYVTGTSSTNRDMLISASEHVLEWSLIEQANATTWIRQLREALAAASENTGKSTSPDGGPRSASASPPLKPIPSSPSPVPASPSALPGQEARSGAPDHAISTKVLVEVSSGDSKPPAGVGGPSTSPRTEPTTGPATGSTQPSEPAIRPKKPDRPLQTTRPPATSPSSWIRGKRLLVHYALEWAILALVLAALGYFIVRGNHQAQTWTTRVQSLLKESGKDAGIVVATINDQTHHLGRLERFGNVTIGSEATNTIRIVDKGISSRHVRLYRRGNGLIIHNTGGTTIAVNSIPLKPKAKQPLALPAIVELGEATKLALSLLRPKSLGSAPQEVRHEQPTAPQLA